MKTSPTTAFVAIKSGFGGMCLAWLTSPLWLIICMICMWGVGGKLWPPSSPRSMSYAGLDRGPWVGDRSDVRVFDDAIEDVKDEVDG